MTALSRAHALLQKARERGDGHAISFQQDELMALLDDATIKAVMSPKIKADVLVALAGRLGQAQDNLIRANLAARHVDVTHEWGASGRTLAEIIADYEQEKARWNAAVAAVEVL